MDPPSNDNPNPRHALRHTICNAKNIKVLAERQHTNTSCTGSKTIWRIRHLEAQMKALSLQMTNMQIKSEAMSWISNEKEEKIRRLEKKCELMERIEE
jgi:ACT domain-containing protein